MKLNLNPSTNSEPERVLIYFTQSPILRQIGHRRLAKLLKPFDKDLKAARLVLPEPDPQNDDYFADLANALSTADRLPASLQHTLLTIELPASPENDKPLWCAIHRRIPGVSVSEDCALDRALDLWFAAPDEFPALHSLRGGGSEGGSAFPETSTPSAFSLPPSAFPERPPSLPPEERPRGEEATPLAYLPYSEELRGLLNAGHKKGACAYRCEGEGNAVRAFKAFGPAVLSGIGDLPETLHDRSIRILLLRAEPEQLAVHFDSRHKEIETVLCRKLTRWAQDNFAALQTCDPAMPPGAYNRLADNWRPLFAIAQVAGGDWPRRALEAFTHLHRKRSNALTLQRSNDSTGLLASIRQIFTESDATRLSSKQLVDALRAPSASRHSLSASGGEGRLPAIASDAKAGGEVVRSSAPSTGSPRPSDSPLPGGRARVRAEFPVPNLSQETGSRVRAMAMERGACPAAITVCPLTSVLCPLPLGLRTSSSNASEMYFRNMRPKTTCLYSAASRLPRSLSAVAQSVASKPRALLPEPFVLAFLCVEVLPLIVTQSPNPFSSLEDLA